MCNTAIIGLDIGGTYLRIGIVDKTFDVYCTSKYSCKDILLGDPLANLADFLLQYINNHLNSYKVVAITIGVPSVVDKNHSYVYSSPNVFGLDSVDLGLKLEEKLCIPVMVDRDVNFLLSYDIHEKKLDVNSNKTILGFYLGTGFGNSIYINGNIHYGSHGATGEIGHTPLYKNTLQCSCGLTGCVETCISGHYLVDMAKKYYSDCSIDDVFKLHGRDERITDFVKSIAIPIATEATLLDPDCIVLGGGVLQMKSFPMENLISEICAHTRRPLPASDMHFVMATNSAECGIVGGAIIAQKYLENSLPFHDFP